MWAVGGAGHVYHAEIIMFTTDETAKLNLSAFNHKQDDALNIRLKVLYIQQHECYMCSTINILISC